jgi:hypothetical protein
VAINATDFHLLAVACGCWPAAATATTTGVRGSEGMASIMRRSTGRPGHAFINRGRGAFLQVRRARGAP